MKQSLFIAFCLSTVVSSAQNAFRDAQRLSKLLSWNPTEKTWELLHPEDTLRRNEAMTFLSAYAWDTDDNGHISQEEFNDHKLGSTLIDVEYQTFSVVQSAIELFKTGEKLATSGGGVVTNIADGTAKFLVKRTKEELSLAFFSKLKNELDDNADLRLFFPESTRLLGLIDTRIYDYSTYLSNLRETFIKDFRILPGHMATYLKQHKDDWEGEFGITVGALATDCFQMIQDGWDERPVVEQINYFGSRQSAVVREKARFTSPELKNALASLETMQLFNRAFQNDQTDRLSYASPDDIKNLFKNDSISRLFMGLLWLDARDIEFENGKTLRDGIAKVATNLGRAHQFKADLQTFAKTAHEMKESLEKIQEIVEGDPKVKLDLADRMEQYLIGLTRLAEFGWRFREVLTPAVGDAISTTSETILQRAEDYRLIEMLRRSQEVLFDVRQKKYTAAVSDVLLLLDLIYNLKNKHPELTIADRAAAAKHAIETAQQAIADAKTAVEAAKAAAEQAVADAKAAAEQAVAEAIAAAEQATAEGKAAAEKAVAEAKATVEKLAADGPTLAGRAVEIGKKVIREAAEQAVRDGKLAVISSKKEFEEAVIMVVGIIEAGSVSTETKDKLEKLAIEAADVFLENNVKNIERLEKSLIRYGNFLAAAAEAKNSDDVARAIEVFALPVGSSRLKKHSAWSIGLNAYPGIGWRADENQFGSIFKKSSSSFLIPASVGLAVNKGLGKRRGSLSIYAPLIDVGALFAFRFSNDSTIVRPQLEWSNIISPGAYLVYGSGWDLPISVGIGGQRSPTLKKISPDGDIILEEKRRFLPQIFLAVDIPITHFYTK